MLLLGCTLTRPRIASTVTGDSGGGRGGRDWNVCSGSPSYCLSCRHLRRVGKQSITTIHASGAGDCGSRPRLLLETSSGATGQLQYEPAQGESQEKKGSRGPLPYPPINQQYSNLLFTSRFTWNIPVDNGWRGCANWSYEVRESVQRINLLGLDSRETGQPRLATRRAKREVR